jgi:DNA-binding CsgD family transcriptional regulator
MDDVPAHIQVRLSERQRECLELVGQGLTSKEIARKLNLSPSTVDNHVRSALERLSIDDRRAAARILQEQRTPVAQTTGPPQSYEKEPFSLFALPPLGGRLNQLSMHRRAWHIIQIALMGVMGMTAVIITIAGLVNLFRR